ncbi:hypothetical protein RHMOL_Rhmol01G0379000 [Rhododendron molle]|uniref:Uncharacterized protein n=1 Tax=Rhododendron molle TaxID=49168 RepID=A0ACC0QDE9_RHOML|nr:hypothetical protein RHMOL_Rhmol01G0379000 [Rhododendron molle]
MNDHRKPSNLGTLNKINEGDRSESPGPRVLRDFDLNLAVLSDSEETESDDSNGVRKESRKSRRFDPIYNSEWEFSEQFEDENVGSHCDEDDDDDPSGNRKNEEGDELEDEDVGSHTRMSHETSNSLNNLAGRDSILPGRKRKHDVIITEVYPVSAYYPSGDVLDGHGGISFQSPFLGKPGFSKKMHLVEKCMSIKAPLRKAGWEKEREDLVLTHFLESSTASPIASEFEMRREFEKETSPLVNDNRVVEAQKKDDARLLEPNQPLKRKKPRHPGKGRRKIEIKRLEDKSKRLVTFVKRRDGLFSKMQALCSICGVQGAVLTFSEAQNAYVFGNPAVNTVVDRYLTQTSVVETTANECYNNEPVKEIKDKYAEALVRLEKERKCGQILDKVLAVAEGNAPTEALGSNEVELIRAMMEEMVNKPSGPGSEASTSKRPSSFVNVE